MIKENTSSCHVASNEPRVQQRNTTRIRYTIRMAQRTRTSCQFHSSWRCRRSSVARSSKTRDGCQSFLYHVSHPPPSPSPPCPRIAPDRRLSVKLTPRCSHLAHPIETLATVSCLLACAAYCGRGIAIDSTLRLGPKPITAETRRSSPWPQHQSAFVILGNLFQRVSCHLAHSNQPSLKCLYVLKCMIWCMGSSHKLIPKCA